MKLSEIINRLFHFQHIKGYVPGSKYLHRWSLWSEEFAKKHTQKANAYLHHFVGSDWSRHLHCHPKRFVSIGLWGGYVEETPDGEREYRAPWIRVFPHYHIHRLKLGRFKSCWTLVFVGREVSDWGFYTETGFIQWQEYLALCEAGIMGHDPSGIDP